MRAGFQSFWLPPNLLLVKMILLFLISLLQYKMSITGLTLSNSDFDQLTLLHFQIISSHCTRLIGAFPQQPKAHFGVMGTQTINKRLKKKAKHQDLKFQTYLCRLSL